MGNRLMWENRADPDVPTLIEIHCICIFILIFIDLMGLHTYILRVIRYHLQHNLCK